MLEVRTAWWWGHHKGFGERHPAPSSMTGGLSEPRDVRYRQILEEFLGRNSWGLCCAEVLDCRLPNHIHIKLLACTDLLNNWILNLIRGPLQQRAQCVPGQTGHVRKPQWHLLGSPRKETNPTPDTLQGKHLELILTALNLTSRTGDTAWLCQHFQEHSCVCFF